jgi:hypothetical protein
MLSRVPRTLCAFGLLFALLGSAAFAAPDPTTTTISGVVDDATTGLGVANAVVRILQSDGVEIAHTTTDANGKFVASAVPVGTYQIRVVRAGYLTTDASLVDPSRPVTIAIQTAPTATSDTKTIATTSVSATSSLQKSSTIYRTLSPTQLIENGVNRFGDALRQLPGIDNSISGDTAALGDDIVLDIRGLGLGGADVGQIETTPTLDGHPIGFGASGGFNYQLSPTFGLKGITVYYGSAGTGITGYDAIGGIIDSETIDPTPENRLSFTQGVGTFGKDASNLVATGTYGRLGYAVSLGVAGLDGPYKDLYLYQPSVAYDPSATNPAVHNLGVFKVDSTAISRDAVFKLRYAFSNATSLTLTNVDSSYYEDKTGNGDLDYQTPHIALLTGEGLLAKKKSTDPCPAGEFTAIEASGQPYGTGPNGMPDGGSACQTPQSYASLNAGFQGAGPRYQTFDFNDAAAHFRTATANNVFTLDGFGNRYFDSQYRENELPFSTSNANKFTNASGAGIVARNDFVGRNNDLGIGYSTTNYAYLFDNQSIAKGYQLIGAPTLHENDFFVREAYRPSASPLTVYLSSDFKHASVTDTSYVDPRASIVYAAGRNDVVRVAAGATTGQPPGNALTTQFNYSPLALNGAGGGGGINCSSINSIGSAPATALKPERGVDEEFAYGHRFGGDSIAELEVYNTDVYGKIYNSIAPLSSTGTGFLSPTDLASAEATIEAKCGNVDPLAVLGVSGDVNLGQLRAQGFTISGRQRISPGTFVDYDYGTTSTVVRSASPQFYENNLTIIQDAQLPRLPLQKFNIAADGTLTPRIDLRYTLHYVGDNNTKRIGAYNYSDLRLSASGVGPGTFSASIFNLFNQDAFIAGFLNEGEPLALNQYATKADYAPYTGSGETEKFGLPYRQIYFTYTLLTGTKK